MVALQSTIIGQCTPKGSGAIAMLRLSGPNAVFIADTIARFKEEKKLCNQKTHTIHYGAIVDQNGQIVDRVLFLLMLGNASFTGEPTVEICCHNNPHIITEIIEQALRAGASLAGPGAFSRQAVTNNKIDLLQAEAINELINANSQELARQALSQLDGTLSFRISALEKRFIQALALSEASFEFLDDDSITFEDQIRTIISEVITEIDELRRTHDIQKTIRNGIRICLIGSVNAGKSSLFNLMVQENRAIVTEIPGTTRDAIEYGVYKNGIYWTFVDTAGIRKTEDAVEKIGIESSYKQAALADIILLVVDGSRKITNQELSFYESLEQQYLSKIIFVQSKADMPTISNPLFLKKYEWIPVSATTKMNASLIEAAITEKITLLFGTEKAPYLINVRQYSLLTELLNHLKQIASLLNEESISFELVSHHLVEVLEKSSSLTGKSISEAGMDAVFQSFCVGK